MGVLTALGTADAHLMSVRGRPLITQTERKDTAIAVVVAHISSLKRQRAESEEAAVMVKLRTLSHFTTTLCLQVHPRHRAADDKMCVGVHLFPILMHFCAFHLR